MNLHATGGPFVSFALLALLVFFLIPNRYLSLLHWGGALLLGAFVLGTSEGSLDQVFWLFLFAGAGCVAAWAYKRLWPKQEQKIPE